MRFFTIGYGGRTPTQFVELLTASGVRTVADIRAVPHKAYLASYAKARSPDKGLEGLLARAGIAYAWIEELGNPFRHEPGWEAAYAALLDKEGGRRLERLSGLSEPFALLCAEKHAADCHRSLVAARLVAGGHTLVADL